MSSDPLPTIIYTLQISLITGCIFISGLSTCLSLWIVPLTLHLPAPHLVHQFTLTFTWGGRYLLPSSRLLGATALTTTILVSRLADPAEAEKWKTWAALLVMLVALAPYEVRFIFGINDRVEEIGREMDEWKGEGKGEERKGELEGLLRKWQVRNFVRMGVPLFVGVVGMRNLVRW